MRSSITMMKYHGPKDRVDAARSPETTPAELSKLAESEFIFVQVAVAENPNTPTSALTRLLPGILADDNGWQILLGMLRNPRLPDQLYAEIGRRVMAEISTINPRDYYPTEVVVAFAQSSSAPDDVVSQLADAALVPKHLRGRIATPATNMLLLRKLSADPSEKVCARALNAIKTIEQRA